MTDNLTHNAEMRTDLYCHDCGKNFIALLDYRIDGNHVAECPHCGHSHYRVIQKGKITEERWNSAHGSDKAKDGIRARRVWKHNVLPMQTSSASDFIRQRWLEKHHQ